MLDFSQVVHSELFFCSSVMARFQLLLLEYINNSINCII